MIDALLAFAESPLLLATATLTAVAIVTAWLMVRSSSPATPVRSNTFSTTPGPRGRVTRLITYPVKSCAGIDLREATLGVGGFERDREWMVVRRVAPPPSHDAADAKSGGDGDDVNNAVEWEKLTIREYPHLATLQPSFTVDGEQLILTTPDDGASLVVEEPTGGAAVECLMWRARVRGVDQGDAAAEFITAFLRRNERKVERAVRLIRMAGDDPQGLCRLDGDGKYAPVVQGLPADLQDGVTRFADWAPLSLVTTQSLDWLRGTLRKSSPSPAVAENLVARLRTNIIVDCALPTGGEMRGDGGEEAEGERRGHGGCCGTGSGTLCRWRSCRSAKPARSDIIERRASRRIVSGRKVLSLARRYEKRLTLESRWPGARPGTASRPSAMKKPHEGLRPCMKTVRSASASYCSTMCRTHVCASLPVLGSATSPAAAGAPLR